MGKKILKILLFIFIVLIIVTVVLIGYRASIVLKVYKAENKIYTADNVKIVSNIKDMTGDWEEITICKKDNIERVSMVSDFESGTLNYDTVYDLKNKLQIDVKNKTFFVDVINLELISKTWYRYPGYSVIYPDDYNKGIKDYVYGFWYYANLVLKGYPHYFTDENGRELISIQYGSYILYFDKETGIFYERYELKQDGSINLINKYNVEFGIVTDSDIEYGNINEYYQFVSE